MTKLEIALITLNIISGIDILILILVINYLLKGN